MDRTGKITLNRLKYDSALVSILIDIINGATTYEALCLKRGVKQGTISEQVNYLETLGLIKIMKTPFYHFIPTPEALVKEFSYRILIIERKQFEENKIRQEIVNKLEKGLIKK